MEKLNVAVVGVGAMGKSHARIYSGMENVNLTAVCDTNKETAKAISQMYNTNHYNDFKKMVKKEKIEAVSVCVPTIFHKKVADHIIKNKINLLVEKPIA